ncbi:MAG: AbrB/MazE/SpoVT family DNA-binding domain-containing protein [Methanobacteriota archaeon]|nr:MAG: AbrB/MazE/SpoVT family DNA-binding domain-containing protein [Euryarchaeota archaeon]
MPAVLAKAKRVGGSIMVTLPKQIVDLLGVVEGDVVELEVQLPRRSFLGSLRGIGAFTEADRADHE